MPDEPVWFVHAGGEQRGPLSRDEVRTMAADGRLGAADLVWQSGTPEWVRASDASALAEPAPAAPPVPREPPPPGAPAATSAPRAPRSPREPLLSRLARDLSSAELSEILPLSRIGEPEVLGAVSTWLLLAFALAPLAFAFLVEDPGARLRLFRLAAGAAWCVFLVGAFRPARASIRLFTALFCAGGLAAALLVLALPGVPPLSWLLSLTEPARAWPARLCGWLSGAGLADEGAKLLLVVLLARLFGGLMDSADGLFGGLVVGLGFGLVESAAAPGLAGTRGAGLLAFVSSPTEGIEGLFVSSLARALALVPLEAAWGGIAGSFAGLAASRRAPFLILPGLAGAVLLHGAYETFRAADQGFAALVVASATLLFLLALRRGAEISPPA